jgi:hypothetical protein
METPDMLPWFRTMAHNEAGWQHNNHAPDERQLWTWAHDGDNASGWIEFGTAGRLITSFTKKEGTWQQHPTNTKQVMVAFCTKIHFIEPTTKEDEFYVVGKFKKTEGNLAQVWKLMEEHMDVHEEFCKTKGWPYHRSQEFGYTEDNPRATVTNNG